MRFGVLGVVVAFLDRWVALDPETHLVPPGHHPCARCGHNFFFSMLG